MKWLVTILTVVLRALLPAIFRSARPTAEDAAPQPELRNRLRERVRKTWGAAALCLFAVLLLPGCGGGSLFTRTIYVPHGEPVRLRETIKNAKVWVLDADGKPVAGKMNLREGWYCLDADDREESDE
jgi:hypothetical protein